MFIAKNVESPATVTPTVGRIIEKFGLSLDLPGYQRDILSAEAKTVGENRLAMVVTG